MKISNVGAFLALSQLCIISAVDKSAAWAIASGDGSTDMSNPVLSDMSRQCIKIWCRIRNLVENNADLHVKHSAEIEYVEDLDALLCRIMKVRDTISHFGTQTVADTQTAAYIDSSLDCIGQYTYDLVERYPGSWSTIIQEQVFRTQEAYVNHIVPLLTK